MRRIRAFAEKIGGGGLLDGFFGQFPEGFFTDLFTQLLMSWIGGCALPTDGADAKSMAEEGWDERSGRYDRGLFRRATRSVREEARNLGQRMSPKEMKTVARVGLDSVRHGDPSELTEGILEKR